MKRLIFSFLIVLFGSLLYAAEPDSVFVNSGSNPIDRETCTLNGKRLYGRVKVVDVNADFRVKIVTAHTITDLNVLVVNAWPDECGLWQFVEANEDFTVQFVDAFPDFSIMYVNAYTLVGVED